MITWKEHAKDLLRKIDNALDGGEQLKLIAEALQSTYESGIGEGISMERGLTNGIEDLYSHRSH